MTLFCQRYAVATLKKQKSGGTSFRNSVFEDENGVFWVQLALYLRKVVFSLEQNQIIFPKKGKFIAQIIFYLD